ncbi:MAG: putative purple acid phosphatase precursor [Acidobacteriales bacterium]|nr:putative purple acid phosphatase precursor [Terriglobales bacterium]
MTSLKRPLFVAVFILACTLALSSQSPDAPKILPTFFVQDVGPKFSLIAYGDIRFTDPDKHDPSNAEVRRALVQKIADEKPGALLITGDIPYHGGKQPDWEVADAELKPLWDAKTRIYPALGNHELADGEAAGLKNWWKRFPQLDQKRWYSVQFGNCYFIVLDSDSDLKAGSTQWEWATSQLTHLPAETDFVFLTMHHPSYTDSHEHRIPGRGHSARPQEQHLAEYLEELQPKLRARIIAIAGHVHNYERFEKNSVTYLVSGGGGATPYLFDRSANDKYQGGRAVNYHYLRFEIDGAKLKAKMMKLNTDDKDKMKFEERDSFELSAAPQKK